jgi:hypothetical protein
MSSFSCPHINTETSYCIKLDVDCIPGRKGCVLSSRKYAFAFPAEDRIKKKKTKDTKNFKISSDNR